MNKKGSTLFHKAHIKGCSYLDGAFPASDLSFFAKLYRPLLPVLLPEAAIRRRPRRSRKEYLIEWRHNGQGCRDEGGSAVSQRGRRWRSRKGQKQTQGEVLPRCVKVHTLCILLHCRIVLHSLPAQRATIYHLGFSGGTSATGRGEGRSNFLKLCVQGFWIMTTLSEGLLMNDGVCVSPVQMSCLRFHTADGAKPPVPCLEQSRTSSQDLRYCNADCFFFFCEVQPQNWFVVGFHR